MSRMGTGRGGGGGEANMNRAGRRAAIPCEYKEAKK